MTFPQHLSLEEKREANRLKMAKYRAENRDKVRLLDRKRYPKRHEQRRKVIFEGKKCALCGILLVTPIYGAVGTRVHCVSCASDKKTILRLRMRLWRKKKNAGRISKYTKRPRALAV